MGHGLIQCKCGAWIGQGAGSDLCEECEESIGLEACDGCKEMFDEEELTCRQTSPVDYKNMCSECWDNYIENKYI